VVIWDAHKNKPEREITCLSQVRGVRLQPGRVVVILRNWIRIYGTERIPNLLAKYPTADNPHGICCECGPRKIAFPGRTRGQVQLVDFEKDDVSIIPAHSTALRALASTVDGELLATASSSGTIIRVWSTTKNSKLVELRRGADNATIFSLGFNPSGTMLASTSDKGTLHVFDVPHAPGQSYQPQASQRQAVEPGRTESRLGDDFEVASTVDDGHPDGRTGDAPKKWGILGKIPFMPQYFRDIVSFASDTFDTHEEAQTANLRRSFAQEMELATQPKGIIGWPKDDTVVVVGCGCNARFEKWAVAAGSDGKRSLIRQGWVNYLEKER